MSVPPLGRFVNHLILNRLFWGPAAPHRLHDVLLWKHVVVPKPPRRRQSWLRRECFVVFAGLALAGALSPILGCNTVNPNLGVAPTQTSSVTLLTPASMAAGAQCTPGCTLLVNGAGFVSGSTVTFANAALVTTFVNADQLSAVLTTANVATPGNFPVGVTSPGSTSGTAAGNNLSNFALFTVGPANNPVPTITQLSPASSAAGHPGFTLAVSGTNFMSSSQVNWNSAARTTTFVSATQLTAQIAPADIAFAGTAKVTVFNPAPGGGVSNSQLFTITSSGMAAGVAGEKAAFPGEAAAMTAAISAGSRYVAFVAADAVTAVDEIFIRDTCQGQLAGCAPQTILVSAAIIGAGSDGASRSPAISADGRLVVFASDATNLVAGDNNGAADIFLRDTCIGAPVGCSPATTLISVAPDGSSANAPSAAPSISADGRFVAFSSEATNLLPAGASPSSASSTTAANTAPSDSAAAVSAATFLRDTCFGAASACTPSTAPLATSSSTSTTP
jgi:WD40-like Beta Propeller Repeat